jgi:hypothetical protein
VQAMANLELFEDGPKLFIRPTQIDDLSEVPLSVESEWDVYLPNGGEVILRRMLGRYECDG